MLAGLGVRRRPGRALFLLSSDAVLDRVKAGFAATEAELIAANMSEEQESALRAAFQQED